MAADKNQKDVAALLLTAKPEVDPREKKGWTPLHLAAQGGQMDLAALLLSSHADVNAKTLDGMTPLHLAAAHNRKNFVGWLLTNGAEANLKDNKGQTPLHFAAKGGFKEVAELLITSKADLNIRDTGGATPLLSAIAAGKEELAVLLLTRGADAKVSDNDGNTAFTEVVMGKKYAIGEAFLLNALVADGIPANANVLTKPELIPWGSFGGSLATQAEINKLGTPPTGLAGMFQVSGYLGQGDVLISQLFFVAEDAVDLIGRRIGISRFRLTEQGAVLAANMSDDRGEQIFQISGGGFPVELVRVGSEITPPTGEFVMLAGRFVKSGKIVVRTEGLELEPGTTVLEDPSAK